MPSLPFSGRTPESREASQSGARVAAPSRGRQTQRYLRLLGSGWRYTDHEAADVLQLPLSSICSIRNGVKHLVEPCGHKIAICHGREKKRTR